MQRNARSLFDLYNLSRFPLYTGESNKCNVKWLNQPINSECRLRNPQLLVQTGARNQKMLRLPHPESATCNDSFWRKFAQPKYVSGYFSQRSLNPAQNQEVKRLSLSVWRFPLETRVIVRRSLFWEDYFVWDTVVWRRGVIGFHHTLNIDQILVCCRLFL